MQSLRRLILILTFPIAAAANDQEAIESPPEYKVGDSWTYRRTDKLKLDVSRPPQLYFADIVEKVSTDGIVLFHSPPGRRSLFTRELNLIEAFGFRYSPFIPFRRFPLSVGKSWQERYDFVNGSGHRTHAQSWGSVKGWEIVTVPAGTFRCLKIVVTTHAIAVGVVGSYGMDSLRTECWSPEVRSYVRMEFYQRWVTNPQFHDLYELVSFKRAD
jgi:hypothetical protein